MKKLFIFLTLLTAAFIISQSVIARNGARTEGANQWIPMGNLVSAGNFNIQVLKTSPAKQPQSLASLAQNPESLANNPKSLANNPESLANNPKSLANRQGSVASIADQPNSLANNSVTAKVTLTNVNPVGTIFAQNAQDHQSFGMARTASIFNQNYLRALGENGANNNGMVPVVFASGDNLMLMNAADIQYSAANNRMVLTGNIVAATTSLQNFTKNNHGPYALAALNNSTKFLGYNVNNQTANFANYNNPDDVGIFTINFDNLDPKIGNDYRMQQASLTFAAPEYH